MYNPALLPQIDKVVILDLGHNLEGSPSKYERIGKLSTGRDFPIYATIEVKGGEASEIAGMWRKLPPGEARRCHIPPYGLRFYRRGRMIVEASVCWRCNSVVTSARGDESAYTFDSSAEVSQHLLGKLCEIAGRNPPTARKRLP